MLRHPDVEEYIQRVPESEYGRPVNLLGCLNLDNTFFHDQGGAYVHRRHIS